MTSAVCGLPFRRRLRLTVEVLLLFYGLPLTYVLGVRPPFVFGLLWVGAAIAAVALLRDRTFDRRRLTRLNPNHCEEADLRRGIASGLPLLAVATVLAVVAVGCFTPDLLFGLPRRKPGLWLLIITLYPLLSVYPQELVWRAFFFHRYGPMFGSTGATVWASSLAFAFVHVVMLNPLAVLTTLPGGLIFGRRYARTASVSWACVDHTLYGLLAFTVGLGAYFFHGTYRVP